MSQLNYLNTTPHDSYSRIFLPSLVKRFNATTTKTEKNTVTSLPLCHIQGLRNFSYSLDQFKIWTARRHCIVYTPWCQSLNQNRFKIKTNYGLPVYSNTDTCSSFIETLFFTVILIHTVVFLRQTVLYSIQ